MKKTGMRNVKMQLTLAIGIISLYSHLAIGSVIFERSGNDLNMQITESISFESTVASSGTGPFGVSFVDAYSSDQGPALTDLSPVVLVPIDGINNSSSELFQGNSSDDLATKNTNFSLQNYPSSVTITPGEIVVVPSGTFTALNYFSDVDATLPDREITSAFLWGRSGVRASNNVAVPEPATAGMLAISGLVFYAIRRFFGRV